MSANKPGDPMTLNRLYGRSVGKPLRKGQQGLVDTLLPRIAVPTEGTVTAERLFGSDRPLHFEIGFGGGEHMAGRADMLPDHGFIGAEPLLNGVAQALTHTDGDNGANAPLGNAQVIQTARSRNLRSHRQSVRQLALGALLIAGLFTFPFGRLLGHWLFA